MINEICPYCNQQIKVSYGIRPCPKCEKLINIYPDDNLILKRLIHLTFKQILENIFK